MKHFGDITKINGYDVPVVDIVTGGSPCQDLSVAGRRAGLAGERSGLFMEQIRIIKEMRKHYVETTGLMGVFRTGKTEIKPRYMVWENVPGAFSSNSGEDFRAVLEETARVAEEGVSIPGLEKGKKWSNAGAICGDGWSIAWRVHDAQFWGVPQRRKRISLLADFNGYSAPDILFECFRETSTDGVYEVVTGVGDQHGQEVQSFTEGMSGYTEQSREKREETSRDTQRGVGISTQVATFSQQRCDEYKRSDAASTCAHRDYKSAKDLVVQQCIYGSSSFAQYTDGFGTLKANGGDIGGGSETLIVERQNLSSDQPYVIQMQSTNNQITKDGVMLTLTARMGTGGNQVNAVCCETNEDVTEDSDIILDAYNQTIAKKVTQPIRAKNADTDHIPCTFSQQREIRRLTPLECERLQGFPDGWTDIGEWVDSKGKRHKDADSPRYKALGNSIALPFWDRLAERICDKYDRPVEMASLFDGIGGFPLVFEKHGGKAVWASEIEEFPIAVTKKRFQEGGDENVPR